MRLRGVGWWAAGMVLQASFAGPGSAQEPKPIFVEDFETGYDRWSFPVGHGSELVTTGTEHGTVLSLQTQDRIVVALIDGSEVWGDVRIEGDVLFPEDVQNYLGFVYRYEEHDGRIDFGSLYIKGNNSYIRVNPHRDLNVNRALYEEFRTPLTGAREIRIGAWQHFALEVVGSNAHLYVGDMSRPAITFPYWDGTAGAFGFKPRNPGGAVWIDDIRVTAIEGFTYDGPPIPALENPTPPLALEWQVLGPLTAFAPTVETGGHDPGLPLLDGDRSLRWRPFATDPRGAVLTGRVTQHEGSRRVAYFRATATVPHDLVATLSFSTVDDVALWVNGTFQGFVSRRGTAWWDAWRNESHAADLGTLDLKEGANDILVRVVGGTYASGGFFLRLLPVGG